MPARFGPLRRPPYRGARPGPDPTTHRARAFADYLAMPTGRGKVGSMEIMPTRGDRLCVASTRRVALRVLAARSSGASSWRVLRRRFARTWAAPMCSSFSRMT